MGSEALKAKACWVLRAPAANFCPPQSATLPTTKPLKAFSDSAQRHNASTVSGRCALWDVFIMLWHRSSRSSYLILLSRQGKVVCVYISLVAHLVLIYKLSNFSDFSFTSSKRLAKWFTTLSPKEKAKIVKDVSQLVLSRRTRMCNFLEYKGQRAFPRHLPPSHFSRS